MPSRFGPHNPEETYVPHHYEEHLVDLGEIKMNYATAGSPDNPALVLIPAQSESWWGYEEAMKLLEKDFQVFAVDLRGQGRSSRTPGRYSLDNMGNDMVRFLSTVVKRPCYVSGLSSGAVISAWLSAFALPGQVLACIYEDPPLFMSETTPGFGASLKQGIGPFLAHLNKYLGDQWTVGDWEGCLANASESMPELLAAAFMGNWSPDKVEQGIKEYDPEWGKAFATGTWGLNCDQEAMLKQVKVPVLLTHHFYVTNPETGQTLGALSKEQAMHAKGLIESNGQTFDYQTFPETGHRMHSLEPETYVKAITEWINSKL